MKVGNKKAGSFVQVGKRVQQIWKNAKQLNPSKKNNSLFRTKPAKKLKQLEQTCSTKSPVTLKKESKGQNPRNGQLFRQVQGAL